MRIIAGRFRGRALAPVPKRGVRPTADPVREALFNILGPEIAGRPFLDLAAGTGAVGFEALSRGASPVFLVEKDRQALVSIRRNMELLDLPPGGGEEVQVRAVDVLSWLKGAAAAEVGGAAGVVFFDPPYGEPRLPRWIDALVASGLLDEDSLVIVEHRTGDVPDLPGLELLWTRRYGDSSLSAGILGGAGKVEQV